MLVKEGDGKSGGVAELANTGNSLYRGKGMVPHVLSTTNCGLGCLCRKNILFYS